MKELLEGIKIIDMGHVASVPSSGSILSDWGADVIKVEPLTGEWIRSYKRHMEADLTYKTDTGEANWIVEMLNRGKRSIAVDLKKEAGRDIVYRLVKNADVFICNYELNTLNKIGMDYETLNKINPGLVYAVLTGFGSAGPDKDERGFDQMAWGRSGLSDAMTEPGGSLPILRPAICDMIGASHLVMGVLAGIINRDKTGKGQMLELSLLHSALWTLGLDVQPAILGIPVPKFDRKKSLTPTANVYRTKDDRWFMIAMLASDSDWHNFCQALDRPDLENHPKFLNHDLRGENCEELIAILDAVFAEKDLVEWEERLRGNQCIFGRVQTYQEAAEDPQAKANGYFVDVPHPDAGTMKFITTPVKFSRTPPSIKKTAPGLGQHTDSILSELGYSDDQIIQLKTDGVIHKDPTG